MSDTNFVETNALLAALREDEEELSGILESMFPGELRRLATVARELAWAAEEERDRQVRHAPAQPSGRPQGDAR